MDIDLQNRRIDSQCSGIDSQFNSVRIYFICVMDTDVQNTDTYLQCTYSEGD